MSHFVRTDPAPIVTGGYRVFRPYVRADFCLIETARNSVYRSVVGCGKSIF